MPANNTQRKEDSRTEVLKEVKTPLGFFALVVLVVEAILGGVAALSGPGPDRTLTIGGMLLLILTLVLIVAYLAYSRPEALFGSRELKVIDPLVLTAPLIKENEFLKDQNERLQADVQMLNAKLTKLTDLRTRIWAVLGGGGSLSKGDILSRLGLVSHPQAHDEVMNVLGVL
ncbi:hypothetical protein PQR33_41755, partial [Paraburkholderia sediminicola]|uniref:hypothetical protein n=1 Tax=Paraburkholderia sediminicola TaxID=458836 RepID=UPI0038B864AD